MITEVGAIVLITLILILVLTYLIVMVFVYKLHTPIEEDFRQLKNNFKPLMYDT